MSAASERAPGVDEAWGADTHPRNAGRHKWLVAVAIPIVLVSGAAALFVPWIGLVAFVVLAAAGMFAIDRMGPVTLRRLGARRLASNEHPRLTNLVKGLSSDLSMHAPKLWVIPEKGPNALVCRAHGRALAVTESLVTSFTRTELEAVIAHSLLRLKTTDLEGLSCAVLLGRRLTPQVGRADDIRAVALTRYPPALATAIEKSEPCTDRTAPMWFVATGSTHLPTTERIAELADL